MSESIKRRSSSRQLLQNLIRVTAQRSQEDAEEVERERRRRAREKQRGEGSPSWPEPPHPDDLTHNMESDDELKPVCCLVLDEDEGFGDWSHRLENRNESEVHDESRASRVEMTAAAAPSPLQLSPPPPLSSSSSSSSSPPSSSSSSSQKKLQLKRDKEDLRRNSRSDEASMRPAEKTPSHKKEVKTSYSSSVFLPQDTRQHGTGQPVERTSYLAAGTMKPRGGACRVDEEVEQVEVKEEEEQIPVQREWRSETRQNPSDGGSDEGDQEEEELNFICEKREDLQTSRGQRNRKEKKEEEEEAEHKVPYKLVQTSVESSDRSSQEVDQRSAVSLCSSGSESEELLNCYGPMSPTFKKLLIQFYPDEVNSRVSPDGKCTIIERTESLRKSTSNVKKAPPVAVSKIDKKLEQYTHALELSSKEARSGAQVMTDLTGPAEPVASKKNLFEAGEAWNQNAGSVTASKDTDCLKVGVAELINQWVRGSEDGSRCCSPFKPAESSTGKKYKFVVTGHGKYEKVSVDSGCSEDDTSQSAGHFYEDL